MRSKIAVAIIFGDFRLKFELVFGNLKLCRAKNKVAFINLSIYCLQLSGSADFQAYGKVVEILSSINIRGSK